METKLIIGLGNPGARYGRTRHNLGFLIADALRERWDFPPFRENERFSADLSEGLLDGRKILLAKPRTYMNRSGHAAQSLLGFYKLTPDDLVVMHDDIDIAAGTWRLAADSSAAGHNGVQDVIDTLGTKAFRRFRVGIGRPDDTRIPIEDYVLQPFSPDEEETLMRIFPELLDAIEKEVTS